MSYTVLARRYRSRDFDELVGQEPIAQTLRNAIATDRTAHAYLFCGTRGVGKTSLARIFAAALNVGGDLAEGERITEAIFQGEDLDVIEIDGASNRGIQEARDLIAGAGLSPARCPHKIYIIDEVHMLTREAFNALLKTMEEPPPHVKFILCTTEPAKVPATIQSRCQRFDFRAIPAPRIAAHLRQILGREKVEAEEGVAALVARLGNGSMRDALSLLDRVLAAADGRLTLARAAEVLGLPDQSRVIDLTEAIIARDAGAALVSAAALLGQGATEDQALEMLAEHLRRMLLVVTCGTESELLEETPEAIETAAAQARHFDAAALVYLIALCDATARHARGSATARALFDAALVRMCLREQFAEAAPLLAEEKKKADRRSPPPPRRGAALTEVKPPPPAAAEGDDAELWPRVCAFAAASPRDEAKVRDLRFRSFESGTLHLAVDESGAASARYLSGQGENLADLVRRATGRAVRVAIDGPPKAPPRSAPRAPEIHAAVRLPIVQRAMEIFDAVVVDVTDLPAEAPPGTDRTEGTERDWRV